MSVLRLLEAQPKFPKEDLTETNAQYLALALGNKQLLESGHTYAKRYFRLYTGTHNPLMQAAGNIYAEPRVLRAIDFGIAALETMSIFVGATEPEADLETLKNNITTIVTVRNVEHVEGYFAEAHAEFLDVAPRTARAIAEGSERAHPGLAHAAIYGGAIARRFELDNIED